MKEGLYINPYLNNIDKADIEEYLKKIENSKNEIKLIDLIKRCKKILNLNKNDEYVKRKQN